MRISSTDEVSNIYYMYLQNKNGAIYFAKIPSIRVRIYEDAENPCIVAWKSSGKGIWFNAPSDTIDVNTEDNWDMYEKFNLHIPKGTIIQKIDYNFDSDKMR